MAANMSSFTSRKSLPVVSLGVGLGFLSSRLFWAAASHGAPLPVPIAAFCAHRNWSIFCGLYRGQSFAKGEPNQVQAP